MEAQLNIGLPAGGEFAIIFVNMAVIYYALRHFGAAAQAGFGIGRASWASFICRGFDRPGCRCHRRASIGAGKSERVRKTFRTVLLLVTTVMIGFTIPAQWRPEFFLGGFTQTRNDRSRRAVPAHGLAEQCRAGGEFRLLEHVSGIWQYQAGAAQLRRTAA